jgi:hypothetical protein
MPPIYLAPEEDATDHVPALHKRKAANTSRDEIRPKKKPTIEQQTPDARFDRSAVKAQVKQIGKPIPLLSNSVEAVKC